MGLGSTAKKIQTVADRAEQLYVKMNEVREQVLDIRDTLDTTSERVERLERENAEQRALIEALARDRDIDVESVTEGVEPDPAAAEPAEADGDDAAAETAEHNNA